MDASWGGEHSKLTYGVVVFFHGCPVFWTSRRLATVASSTCRAELMALGIGTRHTKWLQHLLKDMTGKTSVIHLKCDNQSTIHVSADDSSNKRNRHVDREFFIANEAIYNGEAKIDWVPSAEQRADILTKNVPPGLF